MRPGIREIAPGLFQSALVHASNETVISASVDVTVLMAALVEPPPSTPRFVYFPIDDNAAGSPQFEEVRALAASVATSRVLSLCHMGENRSGLLSALILVERGVPPALAVAVVQNRGPVNSSGQTHSFWNPGFVAQVLSLGSR